MQEDTHFLGLLKQLEATITFTKKLPVAFKKLGKLLIRCSSAHSEALLNIALENLFSK